VATLDGGLAQVLEGATPAALAAADDEDIHSWVEARLTERIGDLAGQAHLGRSRNEQSVTALRLWIRGAIDTLRADTAALVRALADKGTSGADAVMPGFTHTRLAEPITLGHFMAAHAWGLVRDHERLRDARRRVNVLPLGSGALAGTPSLSTARPWPGTWGSSPSRRARWTRSWTATSLPSSSSRPPSCKRT
jgi:argininosuccinate lyase